MSDTPLTPPKDPHDWETVNIMQVNHDWETVNIMQVNHDWETVNIMQVNLVPASMVVEANAEIARLTARIAELEQKAEISGNALADLKQRHQSLRESIERGMGCCCERCLEDITGEVTKWRKDSERWDECKQRASFIEQSAGLFHWRIVTASGVSTFAAAIDASIEAKNGETTKQ